MRGGFGAIVLAAGLSRRMGGENKLLKHYRGAPLAAHALRAAEMSRADWVGVVVGPEASSLRALAGPRMSVIVNPHPEDGLSASLRLGLEACGPRAVIAVLLADMPDVTAELVNALLSAWDGAAYALVPSRGERWGNPALLGPRAQRDALALSGDRGARALLEAQRDRVARLACDTDAIFRDFDLPTDFPASH